MDFPDYITTAFLALHGFMFLLLLAIVFVGEQRSTTGKPVRTTALVAGGLVAWHTILAVLANNGVFTDFMAMPPRIMPVLLVPVLAIVWFARSKRVVHWLDALPGQYLVWPQLFRLPLELILWAMFVAHILPQQMTFEGYNFDVLTAIFAPLIAIGYFHKRKMALRWPITWNIAGIMLVVIVVSIALTSTPSPLRLWSTEPPVTAVAYMPFIWLPGFLVPLALFFHVASLKQLMRGPVDSYDLPHDSYKV